MHEINIACATDDHYLPHCATMIRSLLEFNDGHLIHLHVLHDGELSATAHRVLTAVAKEFGAQISFLTVPESRMAKFPTQKFHPSCWYRILLPELLPSTERVLYLDSDMVILGRLDNLWKMDLGENWFAAVINPLYPFMPNHPVDRLGLPSADHYLNSGVLLIDLARWREQQVAGRVLQFARQNPDNMWPEQDALSAVCHGHWAKLEPSWNAQLTLFDLPPRQLPFTTTEIREARKTPHIVHFIGPNKPWHFLCRHPLRHHYHRFRAKLPLPPVPLEGRNLRNAVLRWFSLHSQLRIRFWLRRLRALWT